MEIIFKAFNGKVFDTEKECVEYEFAQAREIKRMLEKVKDYCNFYSEKECSNCPFDTRNGCLIDCCPFGWEIPD